MSAEKLLEHNVWNKPKEARFSVTSDPFRLPWGIALPCPWGRFCAGPVGLFPVFVRPQGILPGPDQSSRPSFTLGSPSC